MVPLCCLPWTPRNPFHITGSCLSALPGLASFLLCISLAPSHPSSPPPPPPTALGGLIMLLSLQIRTYYVPSSQLKIFVVSQLCLKCSVRGGAAQLEEAGEECSPELPGELSWTPAHSERVDEGKWGALLRPAPQTGWQDSASGTQGCLNTLCPQQEPPRETRSETKKWILQLGSS